MASGRTGEQASSDFTTTDGLHCARTHSPIPTQQAAGLTVAAMRMRWRRRRRHAILPPPRRCRRLFGRSPGQASVPHTSSLSSHSPSLPKIRSLACAEGERAALLQSTRPSQRSCARAMYVTKNVSVVRVRECLDHPRKGERREEGRKEGRKGREFFGQSTYRPRPAAASWPAGSRRSVHARHRGCSGETSTRDGCREGGGPGRRHVKKMVLRLSAAAAPLRTAH